MDLQLLISEVDPEVKALKGPRADGVVEKPRPLSPERQTIQVPRCGERGKGLDKRAEMQRSIYTFYIYVIYKYVRLSRICRFVGFRQPEHRMKQALYHGRKGLVSHKLRGQCPWRVR